MDSTIYWQMSVLFVFIKTFYSFNHKCNEGKDWKVQYSNAANLFILSTGLTKNNPYARMDEHWEDSAISPLNFWDDITDALGKIVVKKKQTVIIFLWISVMRCCFSNTLKSIRLMNSTLIHWRQICFVVVVAATALCILAYYNNVSHSLDIPKMWWYKIKFTRLPAVDCIFHNTFNQTEIR